MTDRKPLIVYDPETGQQMIIHRPPVKRLPPVPFHPPYDPGESGDAPRGYVMRPHQRSDGQVRRRRGTSRRRGLLAGGLFLAFVLSWIPCAYGAPGGTLLCWGLIGAYLLYRAVRSIG